MAQQVKDFLYKAHAEMLLHKTVAQLSESVCILFEGPISLKTYVYVPF